MNFILERKIPRKVIKRSILEFISLKFKLANLHLSQHLISMNAKGLFLVDNRTVFDVNCVFVTLIVANSMWRGDTVKKFLLDLIVLSANKCHYRVFGDIHSFRSQNYKKRFWSSLFDSSVFTLKKFQHSELWFQIECCIYWIFSKFLVTIRDAHIY